MARDVVVRCARCGTVIPRYDTELVDHCPNLACGGTVFVAGLECTPDERPDETPDVYKPLVPWSLTRKDKFLLRALRIASH